MIIKTVPVSHYASSLHHVISQNYCSREWASEALQSPGRGGRQVVQGSSGPPVPEQPHIRTVSLLNPGLIYDGKWTPGGGASKANTGMWPLSSHRVLGPGFHVVWSPS